MIGGRGFMETRIYKGVWGILEEIRGSWGNWGRLATIGGNYR